MTVDPKDLSAFFTSNAFTVRRCLAHGFECKNKPIKAHSVQNSRALDLLQTNGKVLMMRPHVTKAGPQVTLQEIGRNYATVFTGLCADHDREIFLEIDTKPLDPTNLDQLFLLAYRSVTREYHALLEAAGKLQLAYLDLKNRGKIRGDVPTEQAFIATEGFYRVWLFFRYRLPNYEFALAQGRSNSLVHDVLMIEDQDPTLAVSGVYSLDIIRPGGRDPDFVVLNVVPLPGRRSMVVFSYTPDHRQIALPTLASVLETTGDEQKLALSKLIIERIENFVLAPTFVASWSQEKKKAIVDAHASTILGSPTIPDNPLYMLF